MFESLMWEIEGAIGAGLAYLEGTYGSSSSSSDTYFPKRNGIPSLAESIYRSTEADKLADVLENLGESRQNAKIYAKIIIFCERENIILDSGYAKDIIEKCKVSEDDVAGAADMNRLIIFLNNRGVKDMDSYKEIGLISRYLVDPKTMMMRDVTEVSKELDMPADRVTYVSTLLRDYAAMIQPKTKPFNIIPDPAAPKNPQRKNNNSKNPKQSTQDEQGQPTN